MQEMQETRVWSLSWEDLLEEEMETHSSILAWKSPWTEETGGLLQSMGSQRLRHDWACVRACARAHTHTHTHCHEKDEYLSTVSLAVLRPVSGCCWHYWMADGRSRLSPCPSFDEPHQGSQSDQAARFSAAPSSLSLGKQLHTAPEAQDTEP